MDHCPIGVTAPATGHCFQVSAFCNAAVVVAVVAAVVVAAAVMAGRGRTAFVRAGPVLRHRVSDAVSGAGSVSARLFVTIAEGDRDAAYH